VPQTLDHTLALEGKSEVRPFSAKIPLDLRERLGQFLYELIDFSICSREELERNLDYYYALYEMQTEPRDWPWPDASNIFVPFIPAQVDTLCAKLTGVIFVERFFLVNGNTVEAATHQFEVERYYNAELARHNWVRAFYDVLNLALRDGTAIMEILWRKEVKTRRYVMEVPKQDEFGTPMLDDNGEPLTEEQEQLLDFTVYDDVELSAVELRDFLLLPSWQTDLQMQGAGCARMKLFSEQELRAMIKSKKNPGGWLWKEQVEEIINRRSPGESDLWMSQQSTKDYRVNHQVDITEDVGNDVDEDRMPRSRGPYKCWLIFSDCLDVAGDGYYENVFLLHEESQICAGVMPLPYNHGMRPYVSLTPIPRPSRFYGRSVCELLRTVQEELNAIHNQRNDQIALRLSPPRYIKRGTTLNDQDGRWGPDVEYEVDDPQDIGLIELPEIKQSSWTEESALENYGYMLLGMNQMAMGQAPPGRRTKAEVQQTSVGSSVRLDLMAANIRQFAMEVFWQIHHLKLQYGPDQLQTTQNVNGQPEKLMIPKEVLKLDYDFGISGMGGPLDKQNVMNEVMLTYSMLMQNPIVMQNPMHIYSVTRMVLDAIGRQDIESLIGTPQDIQKMMEAQQKQQQFQQQLQMTLAQHGLALPNPQHSQQHGAQRKSAGHQGALPGPH
jgi:hypothetical protein